MHPIGRTIYRVQGQPITSPSSPAPLTTTPSVIDAPPPPEPKPRAGRAPAASRLFNRFGYEATMRRIEREGVAERHRATQW